MHVSKAWQPLPRAEVIHAIERKNPSRIPLVMARWWGEGLVEQYGKQLQAFERFPEDVAMLWIQPLEVNKMNLSWKIQTAGAYDSVCVIDEWSKLDEFIEKMPAPENDPQFERLFQEANRFRAHDRYLLFAWWRLFFERPWALRGMQNLMIDYFEAPDQIHRLHTVLADLYVRYLQCAVRELKPDGFFASDDLGHQTQPMMSPQIFEELIKPYYCRLGTWLKANNLHWWLHSCGNNTPLLPSLITAGVNVFHPVQKGTMDEVRVAKKFAGQISFLVGIDVQHILTEKTPSEVRAEVRFLIDTFDQPAGGMCLAAGNGIVSGTPLENIHAFLDEALTYGSWHRQQFKG